MYRAPRDAFASGAHQAFNSSWRSSQVAAQHVDVLYWENPPFVMIRSPLILSLLLDYNSNMRLLISAVNRPHLL
jgi:hypothetical protein